MGSWKVRTVIFQREVAGAWSAVIGYVDWISDAVRFGGQIPEKEVVNQRVIRAAGAAASTSSYGSAGVFVREPLVNNTS